MKFGVGGHFPVNSVGRKNLNIPKSVDVNARQFKKAWDLLIELDVFEYIYQDKEKLVDNEGNIYTSDNREEFYLKRRYFYFVKISDILKEVDYTILSKDIAGYVSKTNIIVFLECIMKFFIQIVL